MNFSLFCLLFIIIIIFLIPKTMKKQFVIFLSMRASVVLLSFKENIFFCVVDSSNKRLVSYSVVYVLFDTAASPPKLPPD